jgi:hypothetical protein
MGPVNPINYTGMQTQMDPAASLLGGLKAGAGVIGAQQDQQMHQYQLNQMQRQQQDLSALMSNPNPTATDYANYTMRNPAQAKAASQAFGLLDQQQQKQKIGVASQVFSALQSGRPELADQILGQQEQALQNGGNPADLQSTQVLRQLVQKDPATATHAAGVFLSSAMGPDNFARSFANISADQNNQENQPLQQAKTQAEIGNINSQVDTRAQDLDIKRADTQIKALTAQLGKENNDLKRQELQGKIQDATVKRDQLNKDRSSTGAGLLASADSALDMLSQVESAPGLAGNFGKSSYLPNIRGSDSANAQAKIEQLGGQVFLDAYNALRGGGQITEVEGKQAKAARLNMDNAQSADQFQRGLNVYKKIIQDARQRVIDQYGMSAGSHEGVVMQHPTYGAITQNRINAAAAKAGITPQQLVDRLNQGGQ